MNKKVLFPAIILMIILTTAFSPLNQNPFTDIESQLSSDKEKVNLQEIDYPEAVYNLMKISTYVILGIAVIGMISLAAGSFQNNPQVKRYGRNFIIMAFTLWVLLLIIPYIIVQSKMDEMENPFPFTVIEVITLLSVLTVILNFIMLLHALNRLLIALTEKNPDAKSKAMSAIMTHVGIIIVALAVPPIGSIITK